MFSARSAFNAAATSSTCFVRLAFVPTLTKNLFHAGERSRIDILNQLINSFHHKVPIVDDRQSGLFHCDVPKLLVFSQYTSD